MASGDLYFKELQMLLSSIELTGEKYPYRVIVEDLCTIPSWLPSSNCIQFTKEQRCCFLSNIGIEISNRTLGNCIKILLPSYVLSLPFGQCLFLDCDCLINGPLSLVFDFFQKNNQVVSLPGKIPSDDNNICGVVRLIEKEYKLNIPYVHSGIILFSYDQIELFKFQLELINTYENYPILQKLFGTQTNFYLKFKGGIPDEPIYAITCARCGLNPSDVGFVLYGSDGVNSLRNVGTNVLIHHYWYCDELNFERIKSDYDWLKDRKQLEIL